MFLSDLYSNELDLVKHTHYFDLIKSLQML